MSYIDIILSIPLLWGVYKGFKKGLIIQVATLIALVIGIYAGIEFCGLLSSYIKDSVNISAKFIPIVSFALIFILIVIVVHLLAKLLEKFINLVALGFINKLTGAIFGFLKAALILAVILIFINLADDKLGFIPSEEKFSRATL